MDSVQNSDETGPEKECFDRALVKALVLPEVKAALRRFQQRGAPELTAAIEAERADIWRRVSRARLRVRQLDAYRAKIERRIAETSPQVAELSLSFERGYLRLVTIWTTLRREADLLGVEATGISPDRALGDIRRALDEARYGSSSGPEPGGRAAPISAGGSVGQAADSAPGPGRPARAAIGARLVGVLLAPFGRMRDQRERVRQAILRLQLDIDRLQAALREMATAMARMVILAAERDPEYLTTTAELHEAWQRLEDGLLNDGILDTLRRTLNNYLEDLYTIHMPFVAAPALGDPVVLDRPVETSAIRDVRDLIDRMRGASIGVAGPRGAGKSTLIDAFCSGTTARSAAEAAGAETAVSESPRQWLGLRLTAPVYYSPRDFILYLFAELCGRVVGSQAESMIEPDISGPGTKPILRMILMSAMVAGAVSVAAGALLVAHSVRAGEPPLVHQVSVGLGAIFVLLAGAIIAGDRSSDSDGRSRLTGNLASGRHQLRRRWLGLGLLAAAGLLSLIEGQLSPARPSAYLFGVAAIAASGPIVVTGAAFIDRSEMILARAADAPAAESASSHELRSAITVLITGAAAVCAALGAAAVALAFVTSGWTLPLLTGFALTLAGGGSLCVQLTLLGKGLGDPARPSAGYRGPENGNGQERLADFAVANLLAIRFQRAFSSDWSGTVGISGGSLPINIGSQWSRGASWARQPQTYPELVGRLREFIASVTRHYRVVIGIDELDKLESSAKAEQFLNDIKGIFGIRECYFLVSVSEEAAANFKGRGVPFRDVFDSCFDNVIVVSYLDHASAKQLLYGRVIGWPAPFIALCYALSGGLARDLIRAARLVMYVSGEQIGLAEAARRLCREEANARAQGLQHQLVRSVGDGPSDELLGLLADMRNDSDATAAAATYSARSDRLGRWAAATARTSADRGGGPADESGACRWARDLSAWYLFLATILEFFTDDLQRDRMETAEDPAAGARSLDHLAAARQAMSVNTRVAVRHIEEFRAGWGLGQPQPAPGPAPGDPLGPVPAARADPDQSQSAPGAGLSAAE